MCFGACYLSVEGRCSGAAPHTDCRIELVPNGEELAIVLRGDFAAILTFASGKKNPKFLKENKSSKS